MKRTGSLLDSDAWDEPDIDALVRAKLDAGKGPSKVVKNKKTRSAQAQKRRTRSQETLSSVWRDPLRGLQHFSLKEIGLPAFCTLLLLASAGLWWVGIWLHAKWHENVPTTIPIEHLRRDKRSTFYF